MIYLQGKSRNDSLNTFFHEIIKLNLIKIFSNLTYFLYEILYLLISLKIYFIQIKYPKICPTFSFLNCYFSHENMIRTFFSSNRRPLECLLLRAILEPSPISQRGQNLVYILRGLSPSSSRSDPVPVPIRQS